MDDTVKSYAFLEIQSDLPSLYDAIRVHPAGSRITVVERALYQTHAERGGPEVCHHKHAFVRVSADIIEGGARAEVYASIRAQLAAIYSRFADEIATSAPRGPCGLQGLTGQVHRLAPEDCCLRDASNGFYELKIELDFVWVSASSHG